MLCSPPFRFNAHVHPGETNVGQQRNLRLEQGAIDLLALAGALTGVECSHDGPVHVSVDQISGYARLEIHQKVISQSSGHVCQSEARSNRSAASFTCEMKEASFCSGDHVIACSFLEGTTSTVS
jgi:hypothetical protein